MTTDQLTAEKTHLLTQAINLAERSSGTGGPPKSEVGALLHAYYRHVATDDLVDRSAEELYGDPGHPYSAGLLRSTPRLDVMLPRLVSIEGAPPDLVAPPPGCAFAPRCGLADDACRAEAPALKTHPSGRKVACWHAFEVRNG